jgi:opacity protein-like surface antigen
MNRKSVMALVIWAAALSPAFADFYEKGSQVLNIEGGASIMNFKRDVPQSLITVSPDTVDEAHSGGTFGAGYLYYLSSKLGLGARVSYVTTGDESVSNLITAFNGIQSETSAKALLLMAQAKYSFRVDKTVMPYIGIGLGMHHSQRKMTAQPNNAFVWSDTSTSEERTLVDGSASAFAAGYDVGLDFRLGERTLLGIEGRVTYLGDADYGQTAQGAALGASMDSKATLIDFLIKLGYRF